LKKYISKAIQYILFPSIGLYIIWHLYKNQKADEILEVLKNDVNYSWIVLSIVLGLLSHLSRAMRWQMLIKTVERKPKLSNTFWAVMTGYLANLIFPRMGEVTRCSVISKYESMSFTRILGTVVAERLIDLLMLVLVFIFVLILQFDFLWSFLSVQLNWTGYSQFFSSPYVIGTLILLAGVIFFVKRNMHNFSAFTRLKSLWDKFKEGFASIKNVDNKPIFIFHTLFIWCMYFLMIYVCFFSMSSTSSLPFSAGITILLTGSLGMLAPVQGGIGPWHFMVIATLQMYGISEASSGIFALVVHAAQNVMIIVAGLVAFFILPLINRTVREGSYDKEDIEPFAL